LTSHFWKPLAYFARQNIYPQRGDNGRVRVFRAVVAAVAVAVLAVGLGAMAGPVGAQVAGPVVGVTAQGAGPVAAMAAQDAVDPVPKAITRELTAIKKDLSKYRADNAKQRDAYLAKYLDRFPAAEQADLRKQTTDALVELKALQRQVDRAESLARTGAPRKQVAAVVSRAATSAAALTARGDISFDDANKLAASRLSLGEALRAWVDYSRSLERLSAIADRLARIDVG